MDSTGVMIHGICSLHGQWIPGDQRGWRSRRHKRHSSGDYQNPPPESEHEGLRQYVRRRMKQPPVLLRPDQRPIVGSSFVFKLRNMGCDVRVVACSGTHLHVLCTATEPDAVKQLGKAKQFASLKLPERLGQLWAQRSKVIPIRDEAHAENVFDYICDHGEQESAWVWRYDCDPPPERLNPSRT